MRKILFIFLAAAIGLVVFGLDWQKLTAQESPFAKLEIMTVIQPPRAGNREKSAYIKGIQALSAKQGIAFTSDALFRTDDSGASWQEVGPPQAESESIAGVFFLHETAGWLVLIDRRGGVVTLAETRNGGASWTRTAVALRSEDLTELAADRAELEMSGNGEGVLAFTLASSSNFRRRSIYRTADDGQSWHFSQSVMEKRTSEANASGQFSGESVLSDLERDGSRWLLTASGSCEGFKTGCVQETKIFINGREATPPAVRELARAEREKARREAQESILAASPGGATRISLNRGFDKCTAATVSDMRAWWDHSPFYDANIYISGRNRGCSQPQLTAGWVNQVSAMGWGLIPTIVGYQAPCVTSTNPNLAKHSLDPAVAETQGRGEADIAITDANNLGLTQGTVLYYDMERYDETTGTPGCRTAVKAFLKGWTDRVKERGYISGVYGSPTNAVNDWLNIPAASRMDAVWLARWDNVPSVWTYLLISPAVPDTAWANHQRIKQWQGPHNETWGGVTFNIDGNIADGPVAGARPAKNKPADFDGDGRTDVSVWRPDGGVWYVANSSNSSYSILSFGLGTDILAPGDYDGDGKTDFAVWRPSDGVWHMYSRSIYRAYQFGATGDIPVPADYDGDGRTDIAVFRPSTGVWYVAHSFDSRGTSFHIQQFGLSGDRPVAGDYDGDGRADLAVWRPSDGVWYLLRSTEGFAAAQFGISTDRPVQADYDGDGRTDLGIYRDGVWYLFQSQAGIHVTQFGLASDRPAAGDYDGDGRSDIAVYRPDTGVWYVRMSQGGYLITQFGISIDRPVPSAYVPQN